MDMTQKNNKPVVVHMDVRKLKGKPDTNLPSFSKVKLEKLIEEAVVDVYGEKEQVGVFLTMIHVTRTVELRPVLEIGRHFGVLLISGSAGRPTTRAELCSAWAGREARPTTP